MTKRHGPGCSCCMCQPTPDRTALARKRDRFDSKPSGGARSVAPEIDKNALGPSCHLDNPRATRRDVSGGHLGTGSDSLASASASIKSGARAPRAVFSVLSRR